MKSKHAAELFGTFWLVRGGCGTAVFAAPHVGVLGVSLAFGLTVLSMAYAIGHISGCHLNPAVSVGLWAGGRLDGKELPGYIIAQVLGVTSKSASPGFAGLAIGLCLTLIHLISIPIMNTSVNPARSTGPALFVGGWALGQLWLFWVAPIAGAFLAGHVHRRLEPDSAD